MPAASPAISKADTELLQALGKRLRAARKTQKVTAVSAAEAAGISRVTWHRIEQGEPSVTMGAWMAAAGALGLRFDLHDPAKKPEAPKLPDRIRLDDYPQLKSLAWHLSGVEDVSPQDALALYERNWKHVDARALSANEASLINALSTTLGQGRPLV
ncbi:MAG: hypothetical protein JWP27_3089 [Flaviaesturariibacter sp.]|nr:hypothetical protein [Flaviaesturariibacter sp.]